MSEAAAPSEDAPNQMARDAEKTGGGDAASLVSVANFNADTVREQILKHLRGADLDQVGLQFHYSHFKSYVMEEKNLLPWYIIVHSKEKHIDIEYTRSYFLSLHH
jgi:hypothetical protein